MCMGGKVFSSSLPGSLAAQTIKLTRDRLTGVKQTKFNKMYTTCKDGKTQENLSHSLK